MFIDAVKLNGVLVPNGGFETPSVGSGYTYNPTGASWSFISGSGVTGNNSPFTSGNPAAPEGVQVGFIQSSGYATQSLTLATGSYTLTFYGAQRGNYNASYQKVQLSLQSATPITSTKRFIWIGNRIAEERDANNNVLRRFYPQGEQISGASYYYTRDHLGSMRELTDSTVAIRARYDYDPYGYRTKVSGDLDAEFGYTGHYFHQPSGLSLAPFRAYDPTTGRWISRDPVGEKGGVNLYAYVRNSSTNAVDPLGFYGYETKFWADLSVNGNWFQRAIAWPLGILSATIPDSVGISGSGTGGFIAGGEVGIQRQWFRSSRCQPYDFTFAGDTADSNPDWTGAPDFVTPQLGVSFQFNLAWSSDYNPGASSWTGDFREINVAGDVGGGLTGTYFQSSSWKGVGFGVTAGAAPALSTSNLNVNYQPYNPRRP